MKEKTISAYVSIAMVPGTFVSSGHAIYNMRVLTCIARNESRCIALAEQEGCCHTGSVADGELYATGNRTFAVSGVVDRTPREGRSGGRVQAHRDNETPGEACFGADVGDEQDVAEYASTDGCHCERSSLLNLVAVPGAGDVGQSAQGVNRDGQSLS